MPGSRSGPPPCSRSPAPGGPPPAPSRWRCSAQLGGDALVAACRLRFGLGVNAWTERRVFAWMYLVDVLLAPIGLLAALAGREHPLQVALVMPLAGLLVIFARERRGRIENALELGPPAPARSGSGCARCCATRRTRSRSSAPDGLVQSVTGAADALLGPGWEAEGPELLTARTHPDDVAVVAALLERSASGPQGEACEAEWRLRAPDGSVAPCPGHRHQSAGGPAPARAGPHPARRPRAPRLRGATAPPRLSRRAHPAAQPRALRRSRRARPRRTRATAGGRPADRRRRPEGHQRPPGPRRRRRRADRGGQVPARRGPPDRHPRPPRRRRVRRPARGRRRTQRAGPGRPAHPGRLRSPRPGRTTQLAVQVSIGIGLGGGDGVGRR